MRGSAIKLSREQAALQRGGVKQMWKKWNESFSKKKPKKNLIPIFETALETEFVVITS